jgi:hypothetical protein
MEGDLKHRLERDKPTGFAALAAIGAFGLTVVATVMIVINQPQIIARGNPLYWLLMAVPAAWAFWLMSYSPRALRTIRPMLFLCPFLAGAIALWGWRTGAEMGVFRLTMVLVSLLSLTGGLLYNRSLLVRDGAGDRG